MANDDHNIGPPWTVLKLLEWSKGFFAAREIESPRLDAELLLAHVLDIERIRLYMEFDRPLVPDELDEYRALVKRRASREPVAYITGTRAFWTLELECDSRALIPRPDTEVVVEEVLERLPEQSTATIVDVGTGTGALALAIAAERPNVELIATDVSGDALQLARENAERLGLDDRIEFLEGDLLAPIGDRRIDYVVSNPPYVEEGAELEPEVGEYEPKRALFAGREGLDVLRKLVPAAFERLSDGGTLTVEIGHRQGEKVQRLFMEAGFADVNVRRDYGERDRVVSGVKGPSETDEREE